MNKTISKKIIGCFLGVTTMLFAAGVTACDSESECSHEWGEGVVTTAATCTAEGVMTYTCENCGETKTESIAKIAHDYAETWTVTADGHYHSCSMCGGADEVVVHTFEDTEVVQADTEMQTGTMGTKCSVCGYESTREIPVLTHTHSYDNANGVWTWSGYTSATYTVACTCGDTQDYTAEITSETTTEATADTDGLMTYTATVTIDGTEYTDVKTQVISATGESGTTINADFAADFSTASQDGAWGYGSVSYSWDASNPLTYSNGSESFTFNAATSLNTDGDGWVADSAEIKAGWISAGSMTGISYMASKDMTANVALTYTGCIETTALSLRVAVVSADGTAITFVSNAHSYTYSQTIELKTGDTIYFIFTNEASGVDGTYPQADLSITVDELSVTSDYTTDFSTASQSGAWGYGSVSYSWSADNKLTYSYGDESFTFNAATSLNTDGDGWVADSAEIKAGWISAGSMTGISYTASNDMTAAVVLTYTGCIETTALSLRVAVVSADGTTITFVSNAHSYTYSQTVELKTGDAIYFIFANEASDVDGAYPQADLAITVYEAASQNA